MAFILSDRVRETSTAPGTGSFTVNGAVQGARTFASVLTSNADTTWYAATNGTAWETGLLTRTSATVYARTTIFASSNGGSAVDFATGIVDVFIDLPASRWTTKADLASPTFTGIVTTAGQIAFPATQNPSAGANTLDDYEEATWTPILNGATVVGAETHSGTLTKMGNRVCYDLSIDSATTIASTGGTTYVSGFPFAVGISSTGSTAGANGDATCSAAALVTSTGHFLPTFAATTQAIKGSGQYRV